MYKKPSILINLLLLIVLVSCSGSKNIHENQLNVSAKAAESSNPKLIQRVNTTENTNKAELPWYCNVFRVFDESPQQVSVIVDCVSLTDDPSTERIECGLKRSLLPALDCSFYNFNDMDENESRCMHCKNETRRWNFFRFCCERKSAYLSELGELEAVTIEKPLIVTSYADVKDPELDRSSALFVDKNIVSILSNLHTGSYREFAISSKKINCQQKQEFMQNYLKEFGKFKRVVKVEGGYGFNIDAYDPPITVATYIAKSEFENGILYVKLNLVQENGEWVIFFIDLDPKNGGIVVDFW